MRLKELTATLALILVLGVGPATEARHGNRWEQLHSQKIPAAEFSSIVRDFSEEDGYFRSDNFISNETSYLHVLDKMKSLECRGGAYIGVGPEQNFTYIAKIRPKIAFIVDIRRQAVIQHLMYKAIFHLAKSRAEFLSYLFSKPISAGAGLDPDTPIEKIIDYFEKTPADPSAFADNLELIEETIQKRFDFPLSLKDQDSLEYVYDTFRNESLNIQYRSDIHGWPVTPWGAFPTLREIILETDLKGKLGNFLVERSDYDFVRDLQERNRIIPVVGDFAGSKALPSVANYLESHGYRVSVFYTSNVEQYLFSNGVFNAFAENVRKLPTNGTSLFIRSFPNMREPHPARVRGHRLTTLLERISVFLKDYDRGLYTNYWSLVTTDYIHSY